MTSRFSFLVPLALLGACHSGPEPIAVPTPTPEPTPKLQCAGLQAMAAAFSRKDRAGQEQDLDLSRTLREQAQATEVLEHDGLPGDERKPFPTKIKLRVDGCPIRIIARSASVEMQFLGE